MLQIRKAKHTVLGLANLLQQNPLKHGLTSDCIHEFFRGNGVDVSRTEADRWSSHFENSGNVENQVRMLGSAKGRRNECSIFREMLVAIARTKGRFLIVIEDLHWADATTLEFLEDILRWSQVTGGKDLIFGILTSRSERHNHWQDAYPTIMTVERLKPLHDDAALELISSVDVDSQLSPEVRESIKQTSCNVPYFLLDLLRREIHGGGDPSQVDALSLCVPNAAFDVARVCSVLGREFSIDEAETLFQHVLHSGNLASGFSNTTISQLISGSFKTILARS